MGAEKFAHTHVFAPIFLPFLYRCILPAARFAQGRQGRKGFDSGAVGEPLCSSVLSVVELYRILF